MPPKKAPATPAGNDYAWALAELKAGRSVKRPAWTGLSVSLTGTKFTLTGPKGAHAWVPSHDDQLATDWTGG